MIPALQHYWEGGPSAGNDRETPTKPSFSILIERLATMVESHFATKTSVYAWSRLGKHEALRGRLPILSPDEGVYPPHARHLLREHRRCYDNIKGLEGLLQNCGQLTLEI